MSATVRPLSVLTADELALFARRGWLRLPEAFPRAAAERMRAFMWEQLGQRYGVRPEDPSTWSWGANRLNLSARDPAYREIASPRLLGAIGDVFGHARWEVPGKWGGFLVDPPRGGGPADWAIPESGWHWDARPQPKRPLFVFTLYSTVAPRSGGTLLIEGSHHLIKRFLAQPHPGLRDASLRKRLNASHPWLARLSGGCSGDRVDELMRPWVDEDGIGLRVVEITGEPGDAWLLDGSLYHAAPTRIGDGPRFLCSKMVFEEPG